MKHRLTLCLLFILGCATGGVAAQLVVPPVRAGTSPTRWEYQCHVVGGDKYDVSPLATTLSRLGAQGWELVSIALPSYTGTRDADAFLLCAKRALP